MDYSPMQIDGPAYKAYVEAGDDWRRSPSPIPVRRLILKPRKAYPAPFRAPVPRQACAPLLRLTTPVKAYPPLFGASPPRETSPNMASSLRKRSFTEFDDGDAQVPTPASMPEASTATARSIPGMAFDIYTRAHDILSAMYHWFTYLSGRAQVQSITVEAMETTPGGTKRRAVQTAAPGINITEFIKTHEVPGKFPELSPTKPSMIITPPSSRPSSSDGKEQALEPKPSQQKQTSTSPPHEQKQPQASTSPTQASTSPAQATNMDTKPAPAPREIPLLARMFPDDPYYTDTGVQRAARLNKMFAEREKAEAELASKEAKQSPKPYVTSKQRNLLKKQQQAERRDSDIDRLIGKAQEVTIDSPDYWSFLEMRKRARAKRDAELKEKAEREKAELKAKEAREKAERKEKEAREMAELEAEWARKAAELEHEAFAYHAEMREIWDNMPADQKKKSQEDAEDTAMEWLEKTASANDPRLQKWRARKQADEKADAAIIKPLTEEWAARLETEMKFKSADHVITQSPDGADLTRKDFGTLLAEGQSESSDAWLNDEIVNAWLSLIVSRKHEKTGYVRSAKAVPNFVAYNSAWLTTVKAKGISGIAGWSRRKGIKGERLLQADKIFFPINTGAHWMMMVISPKDKKIDFLDSLDTGASSSRRHFMNKAREWLAMELGKAYKAEEWTESEAVSSQQTNGNDCGAFACFNALASASGRAYGEVLAEDMQNGRRVMGAALIGFQGAFDL